MIDIPIILIGIVSIIFVWRAPSFFSSLRLKDKTVRANERRLLALKNASSGFIDTPFVIIGAIAHLAVWRISSMWKDLAIKDKTMSGSRRRIIVSSHLANGLLDIPFILVGFLSLLWIWRIRAFYLSLRFFEKSDDAVKTTVEYSGIRRLAALKNLTFGFMDLLMFILGVTSLVFVWRFNSFKKKLTEAPSSPKKWKIVLIHSANGLLDVPFIILLPFVTIPFFWRAPGMYKSLKEDISPHDRRIVVLSQFIQGFVDYPHIIIALINTVFLWRGIPMWKKLKIFETENTAWNRWRVIDQHLLYIVMDLISAPAFILVIVSLWRHRELLLGLGLMRKKPEKVPEIVEMEEIKEKKENIPSDLVELRIDNGPVQPLTKKSVEQGEPITKPHVVFVPTPPPPPESLDSVKKIPQISKIDQTKLPNTPSYGNLMSGPMHVPNLGTQITQPEFAQPKTKPMRMVKTESTISLDTESEARFDEDSFFFPYYWCWRQLGLVIIELPFALMCVMISLTVWRAKYFWGEISSCESNKKKLVTTMKQFLWWITDVPTFIVAMIVFCSLFRAIPLKNALRDSKIPDPEDLPVHLKQTKNKHIIVWREFGYLLTDLPFYAVSTLLIVGLWRYKSSEKFFSGEGMDNMTYFQKKKLLATQIVMVVIDIPSFIFFIILCFTWRNTTTWSEVKLAYKEGRAVNLAVVRQFKELFFDIPFIILAVLSTWRLALVIRFISDNVPAEADKRRKYSARQFVQFIMDIPAFIMTVCIVVTLWRIFELKKRWLATPEKERFEKIHRIVLNTFVKWLQDLPFSWAAPFIVCSVWRWRYYSKEIAVMESEKKQRFFVAKSTVMVFVDILAFVLAIPMICTLWRIPTIYSIFQKSKNPNEISKSIIKLFLAWLFDLPLAVIIAPVLFIAPWRWSSARKVAKKSESPRFDLLDVWAVALMDYGAIIGTILMTVTLWRANRVWKIISSKIKKESDKKKLMKQKKREREKEEKKEQQRKEQEEEEKKKKEEEKKVKEIVVDYVNVPQVPLSSLAPPVGYESEPVTPSGVQMDRVDHGITPIQPKAQGAVIPEEIERIPTQQDKREKLEESSSSSSSSSAPSPVVPVTVVSSDLAAIPEEINEQEKREESGVIHGFTPIQPITQGIVLPEVEEIERIPTQQDKREKLEESSSSSSSSSSSAPSPVVPVTVVSSDLTFVDLVKEESDEDVDTDAEMTGNILRLFVYGWLPDLPFVVVFGPFCILAISRWKYILRHWKKDTYSGFRTALVHSPILSFVDFLSILALCMVYITIWRISTFKKRKAKAKEKNRDMIFPRFSTFKDLVFDLPFVLSTVPLGFFFFWRISYFKKRVGLCTSEWKKRFLATESICRGFIDVIALFSLLIITITLIRSITVWRQVNLARKGKKTFLSSNETQPETVEFEQGYSRLNATTNVILYTVLLLLVEIVVFIPFILPIVLGFWRWKSTYKAVRTVTPEKSPGTLGAEMKMERLIVLKSSGWVLLDLLSYPCIFLISFTFWRIPTLIRNISAAKTTNELTKRILWVMGQWCLDLLVLPFGILIVISPWRWRYFKREHDSHKDQEWDKRRIAVGGCLAIGIDYIAFLQTFILLVTMWRFPLWNRRRKVASNWGGWLAGTRRTFLDLLVDLIYVPMVLFILLPGFWRLVITLVKLRKVYDIKDQRKIIRQQTVACILDVWAVICLILLLITMWRLPTLISAFKMARNKKKEKKEEEGEKKEKWTNHWGFGIIMLFQIVVLDLPFVLVGGPALAFQPWRWSLFRKFIVAQLHLPDSFSTMVIERIQVVKLILQGLILDALALAFTIGAMCCFWRMPFYYKLYKKNRLDQYLYNKPYVPYARSDSMCWYEENSHLLTYEGLKTHFENGAFLNTSLETLFFGIADLIVLVPSLCLNIVTMFSVPKLVNRLKALFRELNGMQDSKSDLVQEYLKTREKLVEMIPSVHEEASMILSSGAEEVVVKLREVMDEEVYEREEEIEQEEREGKQEIKPSEADQILSETTAIQPKGVTPPLKAEEEKAEVEERKEVVVEPVSTDPVIGKQFCDLVCRCEELRDQIRPEIRHMISQKPTDLILVSSFEELESDVKGVFSLTDFDFSRDITYTQAYNLVFRLNLDALRNLVDWVMMPLKLLGLFCLPIIFAISALRGKNSRPGGILNVVYVFHNKALSFINFRDMERVFLYSLLIVVGLFFHWTAYLDMYIKYFAFVVVTAGTGLFHSKDWIPNHHLKKDALRLWVLFLYEALIFPIALALFWLISIASIVCMIVAIYFFVLVLHPASLVVLIAILACVAVVAGINGYKYGLIYEKWTKNDLRFLRPHAFFIWFYYNFREGQRTNSSWRFYRGILANATSWCFRNRRFMGCLGELLMIVVALLWTGWYLPLVVLIPNVIAFYVVLVVLIICWVFVAYLASRIIKANWSRHTKVYNDIPKWEWDDPDFSPIKKAAGGIILGEPGDIEAVEKHVEKEKEKEMVISGPMLISGPMRISGPFFEKNPPVESESILEPVQREQRDVLPGGWMQKQRFGEVYYESIYGAVQNEKPTETAHSWDEST